MTYWNIRIVKYANGSGYGLHEVYYDDDGKETSMTLNPISFHEEELGDLHWSITRAADDAKARPVFDEPTEWSETHCPCCQRPYGP